MRDNAGRVRLVIVARPEDGMQGKSTRGRSDHPLRNLSHFQTVAGSALNRLSSSNT